MSHAPRPPHHPAPEGLGDAGVRDASGHLVRELHGVTLAHIVETLVADLGWDGLLARVRINCFAHDPSVKSSLTFLRRTGWARAEVEALYVERETARLRPGQQEDRSNDPPLVK